MEASDGDGPHDNNIVADNSANTSGVSVGNESRVPTHSANTSDESANTLIEVPTLPEDSANTWSGLPTLPTESANTSRDIPDALATGDVEFIDISNTTVEENTRTEPRYNQKGKLRGIVWREKNKGRKTTWYVGAKSKGQRKAQYEDLRPKFEKK